MKENKYNRIFLIVMDSVGIGHAIDADKFKDFGSNTVKHIVEKTKVELPNLSKLGLLNLAFDREDETISVYTKAKEISNGKDTLTGHLEMMGIETSIPFKTFTETGFPKELIMELETRTGRRVIGNKNASGTEIIKELGEEHMKTGNIIVYTSADSVLQIAAHEDVVPLEELYDICEIAREITMKDEWKVGRIIARPFKGEYPFERTSNRHDYALDPAGTTYLDLMKDAGLDTICIGKISDIFNNCGVTETIKTKDNLDGINKILEVEKKDFKGLCFANLNDFDSKYGHRRDVEGYSNALKELDDYIPEIINNLKHDDLLIITADHGNDPTWRGTDHTRENIPVLIYNSNLKGKKIDDLECFADIGKTIANNFCIDGELGNSFLNKI